MPRLEAFNNVSLDGYFADADGDMSWAKSNADAEVQAFVADNAKGGSVLAFGRITYEMMAGYWPTPLARENDPAVAEHMNRLPKIVFSRTLDEASWNNTRLVKGELVAEMRRMKQATGKDMTILGSGSIVSQLAQHGLIDEYQIMLNPIVLGAGRTMFDGVRASFGLKLTRSRTFGNGCVLLCYEPA